MKVYGVRTRCGRIFAWSASDMEDLFRQMTRRGYEVTRIEFEESVEEKREVMV